MHKVKLKAEGALNMRYEWEIVLVGFYSYMAEIRHLDYEFSGHGRR